MLMELLADSRLFTYQATALVLEVEVVRRLCKASGPHLRWGYLLKLMRLRRKASRRVMVSKA